MTGAQRVTTVLQGGVPDHIPVMMHNFMLSAREAGFSMREFRSTAENMFRAMTQSCERYGLDGIFLDVDTALLASACGADVVYPEDIPAVTKDAQPRSIEQLIDEVAQVDLQNSDRMKLYLEAVHLLSGWAHERGIFLRANADQGPFSLACLLVGMNEFLMELLDEDYEEDIIKLMEQTYRVSLQSHELCMQAGADGTSYGNSSEGCSVISPAMFRKYAKPFETRFAADLKARGIPAICHICGRVEPILADLAETGSIAYEIDASNSMVVVQKAAAGHFAVSGNLDPAMLCDASPERITATVRELCELYRGKGGLILCSGCAISARAPSENIRAAVEAVRLYG